LLLKILIITAMLTYIKLLLFISILALFSSSCVPASHLYELQKQNETLQSERDSLWGQNKKMEVQINELEKQMDLLNDEVESLMLDSINRSLELRRTRSELERLTRRYENMQDAHEALMEGSSRETTLLLEQLQNAQEELQFKEDSLAIMEGSIDKQESNLQALQKKYRATTNRLNTFEKEMMQHYSILNNLKNEVEGIIAGFDYEEIKIYIEKGRVFISCNNDLFFEKESINPSQRGLEIIMSLIPLIEQDNETELLIRVNNLVVPESLAVYAVNPLELSNIRAASIVQVLLDETSLDPNKVTAAGTGVYTIADETDSVPETCYTEIILIPKTPNFSELLKE